MQSRARRVLGILQAQQRDLEVPFGITIPRVEEQRFFVGIDCRPKRAAFAHPVVFGARLPHVTVTEIEIGPLAQIAAPRECALVSTLRLRKAAEPVRDVARVVLERREYAGQPVYRRVENAVAAACHARSR